jgi:hypothetical protein
MSNPHLLNGPEITALLAALGLVLNASIMSYINAKKRSKRILARDAVRMSRSEGSKQRASHD